MFEEDEVQILTDLGLTLRQAKVFLVLTKCEITTARIVANASKIPRQDVYKVLDELLNLGLIEKQISTPTRFAAIPIRDTCSFLLKRRIEKTTDLKTRTKALIRNLQGFGSKKTQGSEPRLFLIPKKEALTLAIKKLVEASQKNIDVVAPLKNLDQGFFDLKEALNKAMQRGVKIRFIIEQSEETDPQLSFILTLMKNPSFKIGSIPNHSGLRFCVYDKKQVSVVLSSDEDFAKPALLWSDCASIVDAYQDYFEMLWLSRSTKSRLENEVRTKAEGPTNYYLNPSTKTKTGRRDVQKIIS